MIYYTLFQRINRVIRGLSPPAPHFINSSPAGSPLCFARYPFAVTKRVSYFCRCPAATALPRLRAILTGSGPGTACGYNEQHSVRASRL